MLRRTITRLALVGLPLLSASGLAAQAAVPPAAAPAAPVTVPHADSVAAMMPLARAYSALTTLRERADAEYADPKNKKPEVLAELREKYRKERERILSTQGLTEAAYAAGTRRISGDDGARLAFEAALTKAATAK
ncbi:MAG: hypothetical protein P3C10_13910 [Gemmatimonadota bacterium]|nr:hypothetical protein [Gemmatimonadota bacterium]